MTDVPEFRRSFLALAILLLCIVGTVGCQHGPKKYQVRGKVLYKNGTVPKGGIAVLQMMPTKESTAEVRQAASGAIGPDGSFDMYTRTTGDGVYAGDYVVVFQVAKAAMDPTPLILDKYMSAKTSPYNVKVDQNLTDLKFEIEPLPGVTGAAPP